jgi:hypothetical protein
MVGGEEMQNYTNSSTNHKVSYYAQGFAEVLSSTPLDKMTDIGTRGQVNVAMANAQEIAEKEGPSRCFGSSEFNLNLSGNFRNSSKGSSGLLLELPA